MIPNNDDENWQPLESNPEVMNQQAAIIGIKPEEAQFQDLLGFEDWAFDMIGKPVYGVIFNFPIKPEHDNYVQAEFEKIQQEGQQISPNLFYMKQVAKNACGSIAIAHVALNNPHIIAADSSLDKFRQQINGLAPDQSGQLFKQAAQLKHAHVEAVQQGDSACVDEVDRHFIAFVLVDGSIYELDGTKAFPINHGASNQENFLKDSTAIIKKWFERDPEEVSFSTVILAKPPAE